MRPLVQLLTKYDNPESRDELKKYQADMEAMLAEITHDDSDPDKAKREFINIIVI